MKTSRFVRLLSLALSLCMILGMFPVSAFATQSQETHTHTGGTATCVELAVCECGEAYGELAPHTPNAEGTACTVCGTALTAAHVHTGGTATCEELAVCECGEAYGELAPHTPAEDDGDCTTAVLCTVCGAVTTEAAEAHTPNAEGTACTVCGTEIPVTLEETEDGFGDGYYSVISETKWELAPGIQETELVLNSDARDRRQVLHIMEADMSNPYTKVTTSYTEMNTQKYAVSDMLTQANWVRDNWNWNVVGAMNCCLSWYNGPVYEADPSRISEPLGFMMIDSEVYFDHSVGFPTVLVIHKDTNDAGEPRPDDIPKVQMRTVNDSSDLNGWEDQVIPTSSGFIVKEGKNQQSESRSDSAPRSVVGIRPDGTVVIMMNDGRQSPYSAGMTLYELADVMIELGCSYAVNCDGGGSSTFLSQRPGTTGLAINCSPSDGVLRENTSGILFISTAPASGEFVRAQISTEDVYYTPGSSVQFQAIGSDLVGTPAEIPTEASWQLTDDSFGTISSTGLFTSSGKTGDVTVQMVYNGEVVGSASIAIVLPQISFKQESLVLPYGENVALELNVTTNEGRNTVTTKDGDIVFTLSDDTLGTIEGNVFATTSDTEKTGGAITAVICGDTTNAVTVEFKFGKASEILYDFENDYQLIIDESTTGGDADADTTGEYYYGWHIGDIQVDIHYGYRWTGEKPRATPIGVAMGKELYLVDETTGKVRNGEKALAVNIDWSTITSMGAKQMNIWFPEPIDVSEATNVGMWIYLPDAAAQKNPMTLRWCGRNAAGASVNTNSTFSAILDADCGFNDEGWTYVSLDPQSVNIETLEYFQIMSNDGSKEWYNTMGDYTFYVDDITVDYSDAVIDRENPYFTGMTISDGVEESSVADGHKVSSNTVSLAAYAQENIGKINATGLDTDSVRVTVDGRQVSASVNAAGKITAANLTLSDGVHTVRFEISDNQGNLGSITRKIVVGSGEGKVRFELADPDAGLAPAGSIVYVNLVADEIEKIQSVTTKLRLDGVNDFELEGMETAYGFEASYSVNANNDALITITRTAEDIDAGSNVLAKIPVRVWVSTTYLDPQYADYVKDDPSYQDKYYVLTPYAMWLSDGVSIIRVVMDASEGTAAYTDGSSTLFSSAEFNVATELNRYRNSRNDGDENFYQNKASFHIHTPGEAVDKAATCTEAGYTGRVFCTGCSCITPSKYGHECDTHDGCGSVITWGTVIPALGHKWEVNAEGKLACANNPQELYTGTYEGKEYVDGEIIADGWFEVDGVKTFYYADGVKLTGSHVLEGTMCTFDANGVYLPDYQYEGFYEVGDTVMYFLTNVQQTGYMRISGVTHYFDAEGLGYEGVYTINGETCTFDNGVFVSAENADVLEAGWTGDAIGYCVYSDGRLEVTGEGDMWNYSMSSKVSPWSNYSQEHVKTIFIGKGITHIGAYSFRNCFKAHTVEFEEGSKAVRISNGAFSNIRQMTRIEIPESVRYINNSAFESCFKLTSVYLPDGIADIHQKAFVKCPAELELSVAEGSYAETFAKTNGIAYTTRTYVAKNGIYQENGTVFYYENDVPTAAGLVKVDGGYYYASTDGVCKTGKYWVSRTNDLLPAGFYFFDEVTGRMDIKNGIVAESDGIYYYVDGVATGAGLVKVDGDYYYASTGGVCKTGKYWVSRTNDLLPAGFYFFDEVTAKLIIKNGIVEEADGIFYYVDGVATGAGLVKVDGYYYYASTGGECKTGKYWVSRTNDLLPAGFYFFNEETARMDIKNGVYEENGGYYYYVDGVATGAGLVEVDGYYYYASTGGQCKTGKYWVSRPNGLMEAGYYTFAEDGKMVI